jgi:tRNA (cmo5U34)-methyltransferase
MAGTEHFDKAAATWDLEQRRVALARSVAKAIGMRLPLTRDQSVLDFGCGTGLVTLELASLVGSITGADTSPGMLSELAKKAEAQGIHLRMMPLNAMGDGDLGGPYDLIVSSMTLHHIRDVPALFDRFAGQLRPGAHVAMADLDEEDGSYHGDSAGIHHLGFRRADIHAWLKEAGFQEILLETATMTRKEGRDYSVFLATARKG